MATPYHPGEIAVQKRVGTFTSEESGIGSKTPLAFRKFMSAQSFAVAASIDEAGQVWASVLAGPAGFIQTQYSETVHIAAQPLEGDPLAENLRADSRIGLLVIQFATRGRIRLNGRATLHSSGIEVKVAEAFGNCQQYIQARQLNFKNAPNTQPSVRRATRLSAAHQRWVSKADTFFIASNNPTGGADASHRGGQPGFIGVQDAQTLIWPDYAGNGMFQTLGNLALNPHAGLLLVDFSGGHVLQLTGQAKVIWEAERAAEFPGAERLVEFRVEQVIETTNALPLTSEFISYSPNNPR